MGKFEVGVMAQVAELEAGLISERTKATLAAAKARGVRLGPHGAMLASRYRAEANERAQALAPTLRELQARGMSLRDMARPRGARSSSPAWLRGSGAENSEIVSLKCSRRASEWDPRG
jgi:DNA invertase Pin-like site-specific DNA recombinase